LEGFLARREIEKIALYARVSTHDQQTLPMQLSAMRAYAKRKGWQVTLKIEEIGSGATSRPRREELLRAARRKEIDIIVVWRLDRWGRSIVDLVSTLQELASLKVGFVSLSEALDLTTPSGRAFAGMLAVFAEFERDILRDRVKAGIAQARKDGRAHGRPATVAPQKQEIKKLAKKGLSQSAIARQLNVGRTSVRRLLAEA
jgi:DNA invertase Pin-like site-specific DNA recombinase